MSFGIPGTSMEASAGGFGSVSWVTALPVPFWASLPFPACCFVSGASGRFSFLGLAAFCAVPPPSRRPTPAAASPATTAPPLSSRKPPRPTAIPPSGPTSLDLMTGEVAVPGSPARAASSVDPTGVQTRGAQQEFADRSAGEEGADDGDHGRSCGHERVGQGRCYGDGREDGDAGECHRRAPDGEITEEKRDRHRTDEHRGDKYRYVRLPEELDTLGYESARRQLHHSLGQRHEDRGNGGVEPMHQLRDPKRDHRSYYTGDPRFDPASCLLAHGGALQYLSL